MVQSSFRKQGWRIFEAFEKHCRLKEGGFASVLDVDELPVKYEDRMETFWLVRLFFSGGKDLELTERLRRVKK